MKKKEIEIILSGLRTFDKQKLSLEQYQTESHIVADLLWHAFMQRDIEGKVVADFGCGNGVFGIGALLLAAEKVFFVDVDKSAISIAKKNVKFVEKKLGAKFKKSFLNKEISEFSGGVDVVVQNPPFGVQKTHADKPFLLRAMKFADKVYTFHKMETRNFVEKFVKDEGWEIKLLKIYKFPLRRSRGDGKRGYAFWKKSVHYVDVGVWVLERPN